jgi:RimJ/RimL family protein N-acetyltransferase
MLITTGRLSLLPATVAHARAELNDRREFSRLIEAEVPKNWPPESAADALPLFLEWLEAVPQSVGWFGWYAVANKLATQAPTLIGSVGFLGPPRDGEVSIGYSVLPQFQRVGFATEMVAGLVQWAKDDEAVARIVAETEWANPASMRVLSKLGFVEKGSGVEPGGTRFELSCKGIAT